MEKTNEASVSIVSTVSSFVMLVGAFGLVFLLAFIESIMMDWHRAIWGVIFLLLTFLFSLSYVLCQKILGRMKKKKSEGLGQNSS